jgi:hypothetical protein
MGLILANPYSESLQPRIPVNATTHVHGACIAVPAVQAPGTEAPDPLFDHVPKDLNLSDDGQASGVSVSVIWGHFHPNPFHVI